MLVRQMLYFLCNDIVENKGVSGLLIKKTLSAVLLTLLVCLPFLAIPIQPVKALGTICIRADGSVDPPTTPIWQDGSLYTFLSDITGYGINIEISNILLDGNGFTLQGSEELGTVGIDLIACSDVIIRNTNIRGFQYGIHLESSSCDIISGNNIYGYRGEGTDSRGIWLSYSSSNIITENSISNNDRGIYFEGSEWNTAERNTITYSYWGIRFDASIYNSISENILDSNGYGLSFSSSRFNTLSKNSITNNYQGVDFHSSLYNEISANNIKSNSYGLSLWDSSSNTIKENNIELHVGTYHYGVGLYNSKNIFFHNNFVNNNLQVRIYDASQCTWDDGYPSGGNYWNDYAGFDYDGDGIGDTPYTINSRNVDHYPLMSRYSVELPDFEVSISPNTATADPHSVTEYEITVKSLHGFSRSVELSATYSSHELSGSFDENEVTPPPDGLVTTKLRVSIFSEELAIHQIYLTGISESQTHATSASLEVPFRSVPYLSQGDTGWCLTASLAMAMDFYGKNLKPWDVATWFGLGHDEGPAWIIALPQIYVYLALNDLSWNQMIVVSEGDLKNLADTGPVLLPLNFGHVIVVTGYLEDSFYVNDPAGGIQTLYSWDDLSQFILDPGMFGVSNAISVIGETPTVPKGLLNLVGGKDDTCRTIKVDHEDSQALTYEPGPYIWESGGKPNAGETWKLTWQFGDHQKRLDPQDLFLIATDMAEENWGLIVNPTAAEMSYEFEVVFVGARLTVNRYDFVDAGPSSVVNPRFDSISLRDCLGTNYGEYDISLKLLDRNGVLLDQLHLPRIIYSPASRTRIRSPANLLITDPLGRSIGTDPATGQIVNEIPDAFYSGRGTEPETITIPDPLDGTYAVKLVGTAVGNYTLELEYINGEQSAMETFHGRITPGELQTFICDIASGEMKSYLSAATDLKPDSLNLEGIGLPITAYIELPVSFGAESINATSIWLNETIPISSSMPITIGDYDIDGIPDLMVKFDRIQVTSYILSHVNMTELNAKQRLTITFAIIGTCEDGVPFKSTETIVIIQPSARMRAFLQKGQTLLFCPQLL